MKPHIDQKRTEILAWMDTHCVNCTETYQYNWSKKKLLEYVERNSSNLLVEDQGDESRKDQKVETPEAKTETAIPRMSEMSQRIERLTPIQQLTLVSMAFSKYGDLLKSNDVQAMIKAVETFEFKRYVSQLKDSLEQHGGRSRYEHLVAGVERLGGGQPATQESTAAPLTDKEMLKKMREEDRQLMEEVSVANIRMMWDNYQGTVWADGGLVEEHNIKEHGRVGRGDWTMGRGGN